MSVRTWIAMAAAVGLIVVATLLSGCATSRRGAEVLGGQPKLAMNEARGEVVFMHQCNQCHPGGDGGLGPAINNKPLPKAAMHLQIRVGVGAMPSFSKQEISEQQMDDLLAYLKAIRKAK